MKKFRIDLLNNIGWKILALFLSVLLWLFVTNYNDPVTYVQFTNIPVTLENTNLITDQGNVYTVLDHTDVVPVVTVRASRSVTDALESGNIVATADIDDITAENTVTIRFSSNKSSSDILEIDGSINNVRLSIEKKKTSVFGLRVTTNGEVAEGYYQADVTPDQNQIRVSGPESVVSEIESAVATVDVNNANAAISTYSDVRLYDADGREVDRSNLTMNTTSVKVTVSVLPTKNLPFQVVITGTPASGYVQSGRILTDPATITVAGRASALSSLEYISIPQGVMDVTGLSENLVVTADIRDYIPDNVTVADADFDGMVTFTVEIEPQETKSVDIAFEDVTVSQAPDGYAVNILTVSDTTQVVSSASEEGAAIHPTFSGPSAELEEMTAQTLAPQIDAAVLADKLAAEIAEMEEAGEEIPETVTRTYSATVNMTIPSHTTLRSVVTARVSVTWEKSEEEAQEDR